MTTAATAATLCRKIEQGYKPTNHIRDYNQVLTTAVESGEGEITWTAWNTEYVRVWIFADGSVLTANRYNQAAWVARSASDKAMLSGLVS